MPPNPLARVRTICLALPETHEVEAWGEATFRVRNKLFAMYASAESHHGGGRPGIWIKAAAGNQSLMLQFAPHRFFVPPYVGPSGWVGVWLDEVVQWEELEELLRDAYLLTAPKRVSAQLGAVAGADGAPEQRATTTNRATSSDPAKRSATKPGVRESAKRARNKATTQSSERSARPTGTKTKAKATKPRAKASAPKRSRPKTTMRKRAPASAKRATAKPPTKRPARKSPRKQSGARKRRG